METNQPVETNTINSEVEEGDFEICLDGKMMKSNDEEKKTVPKTPCPKEL
jgi:chaperone required for assembly of F1-ATPase